MTFVGLILLACLILNRIFYKTWLNPIVLQNFLWLIYYLILFFTIESFDIKIEQANKFILFNVLGFSTGGIICSLFSRSVVVLFNKQIVQSQDRKIASENVLFLLPFMFIVLVISTILLMLQSGSFSISDIFSLREVLVEDDGKKYGFFGLLQFLFSIYIIVYVSTGQKANTLFKVFIVLTFWYTLMLNSKAQFTFVVCSLLYLLLWQKRVNSFKVFISLLSLVCVFLLITLIRSDGNSEADFLLDTLLVYGVSSIPGLVISQNIVFVFWGYHSFRNIYLWGNKFGNSLPIAPVLSDYTATPLITNTYSYVKPYYYDFGFLGVFFIPLILGIISNLFFFKAKAANHLHLIMNSLFIYPLLMQIFDEQYLRWFSNWLYFFVFIYLLVKVKLHGSRSCYSNL